MKLNMTDALLASLIGGTIIAVMLNIPYLNYINCLCCAGILAGGFFGAFFYKTRNPLDTKSGALIGLFSGLAGGILSTIISIVLYVAFNQAAMYRNIATQAGLAWGPMAVLTLGLIMIFILSVIFGTLGGLIAGKVFGKKSTGKKSAAGKKKK